jgi:hypothetical protein
MKKTLKLKYAHEFCSQATYFLLFKKQKKVACKSGSDRGRGGLGPGAMKTPDPTWGTFQPCVVRFVLSERWLVLRCGPRPGGLCPSSSLRVLRNCVI